MFQYFCVLSQLYSCVLTLNITCMHQRAAICGVLKSLLNIFIYFPVCDTHTMHRERVATVLTTQILQDKISVNGDQDLLGSKSSIVVLSFISSLLSSHYK